MNENNWQSKWSRDQVKTILLEQFQTYWQLDTGIPREKLAILQQAASLPHAVIISGLR
jgi:hypothetical protein